eukprot:TRINITY_DN54_c0_g3_i1.p1 TRINITY_DN54_c0_g3~~TRINITY_DN54_c0_g3_i1.p1  ORF type:complete len:793 (-),score=233.56 TRINITY_DN54_c0_g3_i1:48-2426(-)
MAALDQASPMDSRNDMEEKERFFSNFLHGDREYWQKTITKELANNNHRIPLELSRLDKEKPGLANELLRDPVKYLVPWKNALFKFFKDINDKAASQLTRDLVLAPTGSFGRNYVNPRGMTANTLHELMCVEGVVVKAGVTEPKLTQSIHPRKNGDGKIVSRDQRDATSFVEQPNAGAMPNKDSDGYELSLEIGLSTYKDQQKFTIQEAPEHAPPGQIPRSVEVVCDYELADVAKPGDRVQVTGVYRGFPPPAQDFSTGVWPARIVATSVTPLKVINENPFVAQDITNIKSIAARDDVFSLLSRSFAPSICGHEKVKSGLLLQLIGGTEKNLSNGTHLRGDINVLLVGDPSCGKSQMLRFQMNTAPLAISTTGRGSSGVGLTAALVREPGSRHFTIEAGAMVLADRGVICIDEFDKMGQGDRVAIHEAMEQQCVTISKAGMHVSLNARCSVTAAANPIYGTFDPKLDLAKNIGMPDSLLSRFDLVFVVRDLTNEEIDRKIATQVLDQARQRLSGEGRRRGVEQVHSSILQRRLEASEQAASEATKVFERRGEDGDAKEEVLTVDFLTKYIRFCKRFTPVLNEAAQEAVAQKYVDMRTRFQSGFADTRDPNSEQKPRLAVTTRTLEALIRLSTAHAKLKLRKDEVLPEDVEQAYKLMLSAREEEVAMPPAAVSADAEGNGDDADDDGNGGGSGGRKRRREAGDAEGEPAAKAAATDISDARYKVFATLVGRTFGRAQQLLAESDMPRNELFVSVNAELSPGEEPFTEGEFDAGLKKLEAANKIIITDAGDIAQI